MRPFCVPLGVQIDNLPLVFAGVAEHSEFGDPASQHDLEIVVIVEDALLLGGRPVTFVA